MQEDAVVKDRFSRTSEVLVPVHRRRGNVFTTEVLQIRVLGRGNFGDGAGEILFPLLSPEDKAVKRVDEVLDVAFYGEGAVFRG